MIYFIGWIGWSLSVNFILIFWIIRFCWDL